MLARRVSAEGRTRAYLGGRSATAADLQEVGGALLSFYGQHEHRKLTLASAQLEILDGFCGPEQAQRRSRASPRRTPTSGSCGGARGAARPRRRARPRAGPAVWELEEIERADPSEEEEAELTAERERLRHLEALTGAAGHGVEALAGRAARAPRPRWPAPRGRSRASAAWTRSWTRWPTASARSPWRPTTWPATCAATARGSTPPPGRLDEVEERLAQLDRLKRKHGGTLEAVLAHAEACRRRRDELAGAEEALEARAGRAGRGARGDGRAGGRAAQGAREGRRRAREGGEGAARRARHGRRDVRGRARARATDPGPTGADEVEFLIAPNPGVPAGPLRETASGGELSRVMLALMGVAAEAGPGTLVFDEVDAGIGGQTARAVGEQLRELAAGRQVICITHLPQIASLAERHFTIVKDVTGKTARTTVTRLERKQLVGELVRMLGADGEDAAARRHATELLKAA